MPSALHRTLRGEKTPAVPFWFMRQAGRYLPEYRKIRADAASFLSLCYTPELAAEVTLQPLRRFDMDAAILFSDILVVPHAMGARVEFVQGEGPKLSVSNSAESIMALTTDIQQHVRPVGQTVALVRKALPPGKALIGFCGAPWTVACYMVEGARGKDWEGVRSFARKEEKLFTLLMDKLIAASRDYLAMQTDAGADIIQIFDSWAGVLSESEYKKWVIEPTRRLVAELRKTHPDIPVIGFPRGSGALYEAYAQEAGVDAVGIDFQTPMAWAVKAFSMPLQGNLDPLLFATDKEAAVAQTKRIIEICRDRPFIFNLGHGILPHTPIENVMAVCDAIRGSKT